MQINWQNLFLNKKNLFLNFIPPKKLVTFDDGDPPWLTEYIKTKIQQLDNITKASYLRSSKNSQDFQCL